MKGKTAREVIDDFYDLTPSERIHVLEHLLECDERYRHAQRLEHSVDRLEKLLNAASPPEGWA